MVKRTTVLPEDGFLRDVADGERARRAEEHDKAVSTRNNRIFVGYLDALRAPYPPADFEVLEAQFVEIAKEYGEVEGLRPEFWLAAGVPPVVLHRAGIIASPGAAGGSATA